MGNLQGRREVDVEWATEPVGRIFNTAVSANTDLFSTDLSPTSDASTFRIEVAENTGVVLTVTETVSGTTVNMDLNGGTVIDQNALNKFDIKTRGDATYNLQVGGSTTILRLQVDELLAEVA